MKLPALVGSLLIFIIGSITHAQGPADPDKMSPEEYVTRQVANGEPADFENRAQKELSSFFIIRLLTNADNSFKIHQHLVMIKHAVIRDEINLLNEEIPNDIALTNCIFENAVNFTQSHFARSLNLADSTFKKKADFENAVVEFDFNVDNCHFDFRNSADPDDDAGYFKSLRIGRDWSMLGAQFTSHADFTESNIGGKLLATKANFASGAEFGSVRVNGESLLRETSFSDGEASFADTHFSNLFLNDAHFEKTSLVDFTRMEVESVFLDNVRYPESGQVRIEGMTFKSMSPASWDGLRDLRNHCEYDPEFYTNLETLYRSHGHTNQADQVFIEKQRHDRSALCSNLFRDCQRGKWTFSLLEDWLTGYGRSLQNLLLWSIGFVVFGSWAFRRSGMKRSGGNEEDDPGKPYKLRHWRLRRWLNGLYGGFWYSLDLFLPIIELGEREKWEPRDNRRWAVFYKRVHAIIGHLFVPIGLAAWTGIIK